MADVDFSLLDVPSEASIGEPNEYLRAAVAWHFGEDTGSPYWLRTTKSLDFDPLTEINTFADLRLFPSLVNELRTVPVDDNPLFHEYFHGDTGEGLGASHQTGWTGVIANLLLYQGNGAPHSRL